MRCVKRNNEEKGLLWTKGINPRNSFLRDEGGGVSTLSKTVSIALPVVAPIPAVMGNVINAASEKAHKVVKSSGIGVSRGGAMA